MRIEALSTLVAVVWLTAVLCPRPFAANDRTEFFSRRPKKDFITYHNEHISHWKEVTVLEEPTTKVYKSPYQEMQAILRAEGGEDGSPIECCPIKREVTAPTHGKNQNNRSVLLYEDDWIKQRFEEKSCRDDVVDKPCRFIDRKFSNQSRCVQRYIYVQVITDNPEAKIDQEESKKHHHKKHHHESKSGSGICSNRTGVDYIQVRSGCSCEITPKPRKKKVKRKSAKSKRHQATDQEFET